MFTTLEKLGIVCLSVVGFQFVRGLCKILYHTVIGPKFMNVDLSTMGRWAVVTGATDGLGKAYAHALAKRGLDIVLVSRTLEKLESVAAEIEAEYRVRTKVIQADFNDDSPEAYYEIEKQMFGMEIGVLVNNVGASNPHPEYFLDLPDKDKIYSNIIKCNIISVTNMTKMLLPQMSQRGKGVVVNLSSTAAVIPSPLLTVYGATKAYILKFSMDVANEYEKRGVIVQCLMPGYVATKMSKIKQSSWMAPSPETYVSGAIDSIGIQDVTTGYIPHSMLVGVIKLMESITPKFSVWVITQTMENIRRRALRKYVG